MNTDQWALVTDWYVPQGENIDPLNLQSYSYPLSSVLTRPSGSSQTSGRGVGAVVLVAYTGAYQRKDTEHILY